MTDAATRAALAKAVDANWDRQVAWLQNLVRFPSLRGQEGPCQDWIAREFAGRGWAVDRYTLADVAMDTSARLLAGDGHRLQAGGAGGGERARAVRAGGGAGARSLILQGHVDVVPPGPPDMWTFPAV